MPRRIQRKREKGWRMPQGAKSVTRPHKWGNFLKIIDDNKICIDASWRLPKNAKHKWVYIAGGGVERMLKFYKAIVAGDLLSHNMMQFRHNRDVLYHANRFKSLDLAELKGFDLACFCSESSPCHADILLELANPAN